jgi:hypothetical protein
MIQSLLSAGTVRHSTQTFVYKSLWPASRHMKCISTSCNVMQHHVISSSSPMKQAVKGPRLLLHTHQFSTIRSSHGPLHKPSSSLPQQRHINNSTPTDHPSIESLQQQITSLQETVHKLTYLIQQSHSSINQTQSLARRAEARTYLIEHKLRDIQSHIVQIPTSLKSLETMSHAVGERIETKLRGYLPQRMKDTLQDSKKLLTNKYTVWSVVAASMLFYQYKTKMYQRTSEEVANVAAMTLRQDSLRGTIQETLTTVSASPETLQSLSLLFQRLIREENTEQHLIDLIVRALNSEGVRLAALRLLELCFENEELQRSAGEFLKVAASNAVLDESVQRNAGVGIQKALKNVVTLNVPWGWKSKGQDDERSSDHINEEEDDDASDDTTDEDSGDASTTNVEALVNQTALNGNR